jgi:hypothetical protein
MGKSARIEWSLDNAGDLAEAGLTVIQIAEVLGIDIEIVKEAARQKGWNLKRVRVGPGPQVSWDVDRAKRLRAGGKTWVEIGKELDVDPSIVRSLFVRYGLHKPKSRPQMAWDVREAKRLWDSGLKNWSEIGRRVGTDGQNVRRAFLRWNWV